MDKHPICEESGCQLKEAKGYRPCEQASGECDMLRERVLFSGGNFDIIEVKDQAALRITIGGRTIVITTHAWRQAAMKMA